MTTKLFGEKVARVEDPRLLTGGGRYLDDLGRGALAAAFVRSPHAHARVVDVDVTGALDIEGVVAIYTYDDLADADAAEGTRVSEPLPLLIPHPALHAPRTPYPLAKDEVNHVGEAVVMVVAVDRYVAEDACQAVQVTYDPLEPVVGVEAARRADRA
ncbi:MAG TPA: xanthine dehydrogenase family protein molybdopterin-binding subunit, partial [Angustibacter sp.]|nr:xanthine dehydrogenase family protein molybdopterin-binding subunit [Angustibacter sp.]